MKARDDELYLSAVTIGEIQAGIEMTRERDLTRAAELEVWLGEVIQTYSVLSMDADTFRVWARLMHRKPGHLIEDGMIAATAAVHGLTVVTRNIRHFAAFDVPTCNPFGKSAG